jgi:hypothetical protein
VLRGGERVKDLGVVDTASGASKIENGSEGSWTRRCGVVMEGGGMDSKMEKSASAQASMGCWAGGGGVEGRMSCDGGGEGCDIGDVVVCAGPRLVWCPSADSQAEKSSAPLTCVRSFDTVLAPTSLLLGGVFTSVFSSVERADLFAGLRRPGPMGPCSAWCGMKAFCLKIAEVGEIIVFSLTIGVASIVSAGSVCLDELSTVLSRVG